jgi:NAD(P)H-dependent FMN reductase
MIDTSPVLVVGGSTRANRRSPRIAEWIAARGRAVTGLAFAIVDLRALGLTFDDEPGIPAKDPYLAESTIRWSEQVTAAPAIVFVTPQYNWGYPAPLKNAIDHLYREWKDKPALIVSYGSHGGDKCARQLREILGGLDMRLTAAMPGLRLSRDRIVANDGAVEPEQDFAEQAAEVDDALRELGEICLSKPVV